MTKEALARILDTSPAHVLADTITEIIRKSELPDSITIEVVVSPQRTESNPTSVDTVYVRFLSPKIADAFFVESISRRRGRLWSRTAYAQKSNRFDHVQEEPPMRFDEVIEALMYDLKDHMIDLGIG